MSIDDDLSRITEYLGAKKHGNIFRACCPVHGGSNPEALAVRKVNDKILFHCFAGCSQEEVLAFFIEQGLLSSRKKRTFPPETFKGMRLTATYIYPNGLTARYDGPDGKAVIPCFKSGGSRMGFDGDARPLYRLSDDRELWIVEGEKCVDALRALGIPAISWAGGSSAVARVDWSKVRDRTLYIWPDNDAPGEKAKDVLLSALSEHNKCVVISPPPEISHIAGGDVADYIALEKAKEDILSLIPQKKNTSISIADFLIKEVPPRKVQCGFVFEDSINFIYAWRGVGKTWFSLSLAYAMATNTPFLKWQSSEKFSVLYLDGEMSESGMHQRLWQICDMSGGAIPEQMHLMGMYTVGNTLMPKISSPEGRAEISEAIERTGAKIIVVDNLSSLTRGDENDAESFEPVQDWCLEHRAAGRSIVLIHHAAKGGQQRGTSKKEDALDMTIQLSEVSLEESEDRMGKKALMKIKFEKTRESIDDEPFYAWIQEEVITTFDIRYRWEWKRINEFISERSESLKEQGYTQREIAALLGVSVQRLNTIWQV